MSVRAFERKIIREFARLKFTPEYLIEHHRPQLLRLKLSADMGVVDLNLDPRSPDEDPLRKTALHVIRKLRQLPLKASYQGIPMPKITNSIEHLIKEDYQALVKIDKELLTDRLYLLSVKTHGVSLQYLPHELKTRDVCESAVAARGYAILAVPAELLTEELCWLAVNNGAYLEVMPDAFRSDRIIDYCVKKHLDGTMRIGETYLTVERVMRVVKNSPYVIQNIPGRLLTTSMYKQAYESDRNSLNYLPFEEKEDVLNRIANLRKKHGEDGFSPN